jgi:hypothetical protein
VRKGDVVLSRRDETPATGKLPLDYPESETPVERSQNDRAIELSEKGHVEVALYARGLELERDRLLKLIRVAQAQLAALERIDGIPRDLRESLHGLTKTLQQSLRDGGIARRGETTGGRDQTRQQVSSARRFPSP